MKTKKLCGLALASLLVLSGCSSASKQVGGKDVLASIDGTNVLADDIYKKLTSSSTSGNTLFDYVLEQLVKEKFPVTDDMKENASKIRENIETNYKNEYGDDADDYLQSQLASSGFKDMDAYEQSLIDSLQYSEFIKKYVKDNFDKVFEDYYKQESPRLLSIVKVSMTNVESPTDEEKENLKEVKNLLKTDKSFAAIASSYSDDDSKSAKGDIGVVDSTSGLANKYGDNIETKALSLKPGEVSGAIKGTNGYYFLYCRSTDKEKIKEELKTVDIDSPLLVYDQYMTYYAFQSYDLKYNDKDVEKKIKAAIKEALASREDERGED